jgi:hypothetical protein
MAHEDIRNFSVRILVKAKSVTGIDNVLSKVDIPLTCLREERLVEGWFSLRQTSSSTMMGLRTSGSIRLRLQWIYTELGFSGYVLDECNRRLKELLLYHHVSQYSLSRIKEQLKIAAEEHISASASSQQIELLAKEDRNYYFRILSMLKEREAAKIKLPSEVVSPISTATALKDDHNTRLLPASPRGKKISLFSEEKESDGAVPFSKFVTFSPMLESRSSDYNDGQQRGRSVSDLVPDHVIHKHSDILRQWVNNLSSVTALHRHLSKDMERSPDFVRDSEEFLKVFDEESGKNFHHVFTSTCVLEIRPMKVDNIPIKTSFVHVKMSYGDKVCRIIF